MSVHFSFITDVFFIYDSQHPSPERRLGKSFIRWAELVHAVERHNNNSNNNFNIKQNTQTLHMV